MKTKEPTVHLSFRSPKSIADYLQAEKNMTDVINDLAREHYEKVIECKSCRGRGYVRVDKK